MLTDIEIDKIVEFDRNDEMSDGRAAKAITQLRAELAAERELADRLASDAKNLIQWFIANIGESKGELDDIQESLSAHATRRNK